MANEIDRIRTMLVHEDNSTGFVTIFTGGDEFLTVFEQVDDTEEDFIDAVRWKSVNNNITV